MFGQIRCKRISNPGIDKGTVLRLALLLGLVLFFVWPHLDAAAPSRAPVEVMSLA